MFISKVKGWVQHKENTHALAITTKLQNTRYKEQNLKTSRVAEMSHKKDQNLPINEWIYAVFSGC